MRKATEEEMKDVYQILEAIGISPKNISTDDVVVGHSPSMIYFRDLLGGGKEGNAQAIRKAGLDPKNPKLMIFMRPRLPNKTIVWHRMIAVTHAAGSLMYDHKGLIPRALIKWDPAP